MYPGYLESFSPAQHMSHPRCHLPRSQNEMFSPDLPFLLRKGKAKLTSSLAFSDTWLNINVAATLFIFKYTHLTANSSLHRQKTLRKAFLISCVFSTWQHSNATSVFTINYGKQEDRQINAHEQRYGQVYVITITSKVEIIWQWQWCLHPAWILYTYRTR